MRRIEPFIYGIIFCMMIFTSCSSKQEAPVPKPMEQPMEQPMPVIPLQVEETKVKPNVYLDKKDVGGIVESQLVPLIQSIAAGIDKEPVEAKIDEKFWTVSGKISAGRKVDIEATKRALLNAREGETVKLVINNIKPRATVEQTRANITEIGRFTTTIMDKSPNRVKNIELASKKVDTKKVGPGEVFSFNTVVGNRTEAGGYEEAPIIIQTKEGPKKDEDFGGGVCQLSTTLYNAANKVGLEIVERHTHTKPIPYVPEGQDATVSYGSTDLKFKNNRQHSIMIRVSMDKNNSLTVKIFENRN